MSPPGMTLLTETGVPGMDRRGVLTKKVVND
jgi:hypothetical protein